VSRWAGGVITPPHAPQDRGHSKSRPWGSQSPDFEYSKSRPRGSQSPDFEYSKSLSHKAVRRDRSPQGRQAQWPMSRASTPKPTNPRATCLGLFVPWPRMPASISECRPGPSPTKGRGCRPQGPTLRAWRGVGSKGPAKGGPDVAGRPHVPARREAGGGMGETARMGPL